MGESGERIVEGAEVWIAAARPSSIAGRYAHVVEVYAPTREVLVDLGDRRLAWVRIDDVVPAYGGEL
jgi:hypothetical protein